MKTLEIYCLVSLIIGLFSGCKSASSSGNQQADTASTLQSAMLVGGPCEGCEAVHEFGNKILYSTDTIPGFHEYEPKLLLSGTIYQVDGKTPAQDVILYIYHTNREGIYPSDSTSADWGRRHGIHRGWIKTDQTGQYEFWTFRPASYPNREESEHIHLTVLEPDKNEYYLDEIVFENDPFLTEAKRARMNDRGGSGIVELIEEKGILIARRDIVLGENIPGYPLGE